jgi:hypothetical protein
MDGCGRAAAPAAPAAGLGSLLLVRQPRRIQSLPALHGWRQRLAILRALVPLWAPHAAADRRWGLLVLRLQPPAQITGPGFGTELAQLTCMRRLHDLLLLLGDEPVGTRGWHGRHAAWLTCETMAS